MPDTMDDKGIDIAEPLRAETTSRPYPKHPLALMPGKSGAFQLNSGDRFICDLTGRRGWADEFTSDGDAYVCWDNGEYGMARWNWMSPEPGKVT